jgi:hypothetical protein
VGIATAAPTAPSTSTATTTATNATATTTAPSGPLGQRGAIPGRRAPTVVQLDRQYMHRSGLACVRVVPSGGFVWLLNSSARVRACHVIMYYICIPIVNMFYACMSR